MGFFFFFFDELDNISKVVQAFEYVCKGKMLDDGYCDMSQYVYDKITKEEIKYRLERIHSKYIVLFEEEYPLKEQVNVFWYEHFSREDEETLSFDEAIAIVYWIYQILRSEEERKSFTENLFKNTKELNSIDCEVAFQDGVVYNTKKIQLEIVDSIAKFNLFLRKYCKNEHKFFYRGHSDANYRLQPSINRNENWKRNERKMYNQLLIDCPADFEKCNTHLEKLVKMQHYGLPTRLLDITKNPLVALYFACKDKEEAYGEIVLISAGENQVRYPQSDTASILASLPEFDNTTQKQFLKWASDNTLTQEEFNNSVGRLLHEIRLEKPAFHADIIKEDLLSNIIVLALKNNPRIMKQDGAFILCGLSKDPLSLNRFRYKYKGKTLIFLVKEKEKLRRQLEKFSINYATLFPEIDCVAKHISDYYKDK